MKKYTVAYWIEYKDQPFDREIDVYADSPEEAIHIAKLNPRTRRGKHYKILSNIL